MKFKEILVENQLVRKSLKNAPFKKNYVFSSKIDRVINFSSLSRDHHTQCVTDFNIVDISRTAGPWREISGSPNFMHIYLYDNFQGNLKIPMETDI